ncbi:hypothetical protein ACPPVO_47250 [Dactylosporangium sp. McL0621]|uniref:hypothetical protein n=1 Tax=Dactylosporangium sp. McL0621 TaxID=3415678 RepID=UPI003CEC3516
MSSDIGLRDWVIVAISAETDHISLPELLDAIVERAKNAGLDPKVEPDNFGTKYPVLRLSLKFGKDRRDAYFVEEALGDLASYKFENWSVLPSMRSLLNVNERSIVVFVRGPGPDFFLWPKSFPPSEFVPAGMRFSTPAGSTVTLHTGHATAALSCLFFHVGFKNRVFPAIPKAAVIMVSSIPEAVDLTGSGAVELVESITRSIFFEVDLRSKVMLSLEPWPAPQSEHKQNELLAVVVGYPAVTYPKEPMELYRYARSAQRMPLLQFLAFYQVIEFFFPSYVNAERIRRARIALLDPRFDVHNNVSLGRILEGLRTDFKSTGTEREQIRLAIRHCMDDGKIKEFLDSNPETAAFLALDGKRAKAEGVSASPVKTENRNYPLTDQVADRIYDIRCRVVHSKEDGGAAGFKDLLLPYSPEAYRLDNDIKLIMVVAQAALIASANRASW